MFDEGLWAYAVEDKIVPFGAKEGTLLLLLIENKNKIVTFEEISEKVFESKYDKFISNALKQMKKIIERKSKNTIKIYSKRQRGYMLKG